MTESQELDKFAVLRAAAGDREALADVLGFLQAPLYRYILRLVFRPDVAEDVLQDVLFIICRKLSRLRDPELIVLQLAKFNYVYPSDCGPQQGGGSEHSRRRPLRSC